MADEIPASMLDEILSTLLVFLSSANREIVKSTLGFIKLAVHTLSEDVLRPQLPQPFLDGRMTTRTTSKRKSVHL